MITNHEKFVRAFREMAGRELSFSEIKEKMLTDFPEIKVGSIMPWDHDDVGNKSPCWCSKTQDRIFDRVNRGKPYLYRVKSG